MVFLVTLVVGILICGVGDDINGRNNDMWCWR